MIPFHTTVFWEGQEHLIKIEACPIPIFTRRNRYSCILIRQGTGILKRALLTMMIQGRRVCAETRNPDLRLRFHQQMTVLST